MDNVLALIARRDALKADIKKLTTELEQIEHQLKPIAVAAFIDAPPSTYERVTEGARFRRKTLRLNLKSTSPKRTAGFLATLDVDVFSPTLVQKAKLDALGADYSDGKVKVYGEIVPALNAEPVYSYEYSDAGRVTAADLDDDE